jgi:hypothetical protein
MGPPVGKSIIMALEVYQESLKKETIGGMEQPAL